MKWNLFFLQIFVCVSSFSQIDTVDLLPVEVRAVRATEKAPFTKTNLSKAQIEAQNIGQDLPFILNSTPSVVVNSDAGNGIGYTGIRIRGTDATRINVTLNGVPFNDAESGGTFFVNLPDFLSSVNSIQVQRGVGTSSNGGSSFGATINLSSNDVIKEKSIEVNNSFGSFNSWKNTIKFNSGLLGERFTVDARLSSITSDGYIERAKSNLSSFYFSTAYLLPKTALRFTVFSGKEKTYQAWNGVSETDLKNNRRINYAGTEKPGTPYENETDNYKQTHYQLFLNRQLIPNLNFNTGLFLVRGKGFYEQYKANEAYRDYGMPVATSGSDTITNTDLVRQLWLDNYYYGNVFSLNYKKGKTAVTVGGAVTNYTGDHFGLVTWAQKGLTSNNRWYSTDAEKKDANVYLKWQQNLTPEFQVYTDLQWRNVGYNINGFRYNPSLIIDAAYAFFNPKLGLSYSKNTWNFYASYGVGNKEPNRDDFEAGLTEQPKPERLQDVEIGLEQKGKKHSWGATLYYMNYKNQLVLTGKINDVGAYTRTNIERSYRAGIELQGAVQIASWLQASGNLTVSRNRLKNFTEFIDDYDSGSQKKATYNNSEISFSPAVVGAANLTFLPIKNTELHLLSKYVSKQYLDNTANEARKLDAYYTQDIRIHYSFVKQPFKRVSIIAQVNNVLNALYEPNGYTFSYYSNAELTTENYYFPMAGINWMVGLNVKL